MTDLQSRFPGLADGWARFDGPAGTQVVDTAIEATAAWQRSGRNANSHGAFAAAEACDELMAEARSIMGKMLNADSAGVVFGPSTTSNVMGLTRALARDLGPGDEIICTQLDHDSNVAPWLPKLYPRIFSSGSIFRYESALETDYVANQTAAELDEELQSALREIGYLE